MHNRITLATQLLPKLKRIDDVSTLVRVRSIVAIKELIPQNSSKSNLWRMDMLFGAQTLLYKQRRTTVLLLLLCSFLCASIQASQAAGKRLVFVTLPCHWISTATIENCAAQPNIDGLGLELEWRKIEQLPGKYDWSVVDTAIRIAAKNKKYVTLYLIASPMPPDWLTEGGKAQTFFAGKTFTRGIIIDVVPWDKTYLTRYSQFLQAAAAHFNSLNMMPYIFAVGVVTPQRDCTIEGSIYGKLGETAYDRSKHLLACKQMIDSYAKCFPTARLLLTAPQDQMICLPRKDPGFFQELLTYGLSKRGQGCWLFARDLSTSGSVNASSYLSFVGRTGLAYQTNTHDASLSTPENFRLATNAGLSNGAIYIEISPEAAVDKNSVILNAIRQIHGN